VAIVTLDRAQVVQAAIGLLDEVGLDGLTLRRLGNELGVQAPALYWHFKNKQELLDQVFATISAVEAPPRPPDEGESWQRWLKQRARDRRHSLNGHRDGAMLAASTHPLESLWHDIEADIGVLVDTGMTAPDALEALITVGNFVTGFALEEQAERMRGAAVEDLEPAEVDRALAGFADYPLLTEALREVGDPQSDRAFEAGLTLIIDGIRMRARQRRANQRSDT